jgi:hypothetical protein
MPDNSGLFNSLVKDLALDPVECADGVECLSGDWGRSRIRRGSSNSLSDLTPRELPVTMTVPSVPLLWISCTAGEAARDSPRSDG